MNNLIFVLLLEGILLGLGLLILIVYTISQKHPNAFKLPKLKLPQRPAFGFKLNQDVAAKPNPNFWERLSQDAALIWKPIEPEFFTSPDGNTLYLSTKLTQNWKPEQVVLFMLSHKQEFLDQLKAKDPAAFEAINSLVGKLTTSKIAIAFKKMNVLPSFSKTMVVWKLPLLDLPEVKLAEDVIVKELK